MARPPGTCGRKPRLPARHGLQLPLETSPAERAAAVEALRSTGLYRAGFDRIVSPAGTPAGNWNQLLEQLRQLAGGAAAPPLATGLGTLTAEEERTQLTVHALLAARLVLAQAPQRIPPESLALLLHPGWGEIARDPLGERGVLANTEDGGQLWVRRLAKRHLALGMVNPGERPISLNAVFRRMKVDYRLRVQQIWKWENWGVVEAGFAQRVEPHGAVLFRLRPLR